MHWLLGGYLWLFVIVRSSITRFGRLTARTRLHVLMIGWWIVTPNKTWHFNRLYAAILGFAAALVCCWLASPYRDECWDTVENYLKVAVFSFLLVTSVRRRAWAESAC